MQNKLCFITDLDSIILSNPPTLFGPIDQLNFRIGNSFSLSVESKAYAICDSVVLIQYNDIGNLNIILKPINRENFLQPVDYFIYQNISVDSILDSTEIATRTNNDLTEYLWKNQEIADTNEGVSPRIPKAEFTGVLTSIETSEFYISSDKDIFQLFHFDKTYQLPILKAGDYLGNFVGGNTTSGIIVYRESINHFFSLELFRRSDTIFTCALNNSSMEIEQLYEKESILCFMDCISLFGDLAQINDLVEFKNLGNVTVSKEIFFETIYDYCSLYIDIRNENGLSYDFFKEYGSVLNLIKTSETLTDINYYGTFLWPIMRFSANDLTETTVVSLQSTFDWVDNYFLNYNSIENNTAECKFIYPDENLDITLFWGSFTATNNPLLFPGLRTITLKASQKNSNPERLIIRNPHELSHIFNIKNIRFSERQNSIGISLKLFQENYFMLKENIFEPYGDLYISDIAISSENERYIFSTIASKYVGFYRDSNLLIGQHLLKSLYSKSYNGIDELITCFYPESTFTYHDDSEQYPGIKTSAMFTDIVAESTSLVSTINFDSISISLDDWEAIQTILDENNELLLNLPIYLTFDYENIRITELNSFFEFETEILISGFKTETSEGITTIVPVVLNTGIQSISNSFNSQYV